MTLRVASAPAAPEPLSLQDQFGRIDIYVFDQLLRGNIAPGMRVLDAGCGHGRNLIYLLREGYDVYGVDAGAEAILELRAMAQGLRPDWSLAEAEDRFRMGSIEKMPFPADFADVVLCNSVLHFAWDTAHFDQMVASLWRAVRPGGMLFCRLASRIGKDFPPVRENLFRMEDEQEWFLVDEAMLMERTRALGGELIDPLKTTVIQNSRCMTTWVLRKPM